MYNEDGDNMKTCLVLEGGALRGIYTAGVLDELLKENISVDAIIGVSMGSLMAINYISKQPGRAIRYNKKYCVHRNCIGITSLLKTGDIVNKEVAYYKIPQEWDPFDYQAFDKSPIKLYCTLTNVETGKAEYKEINHSLEETEYLRAGASMPGVSKIIEIDNKKYLDGGIADSIPVKKAIEMGFDKIIVALTRPIEYRKRKSTQKLLRFLYRKYPHFGETLKNRNALYNQTVEEIIKLEKEKRIFVIRPSKKIPIKRIEHNPEMVQAQYDLGVKDFIEQKNNLLEYLKE